MTISAIETPRENLSGGWSFPSSKIDPLVQDNRQVHQQENATINDFAKERLGVASSLLLTLAAKHRPTAMHSIRVALGCSGWGHFLKLSAQQCRTLEIAGALHDLGKVGVCDSILQKSASLTREEMASIEYHRQNVLSILQPSLICQEIAETIYYGIAFFDGSKAEFNRKQDELPLTARMLSIADAFDSMTMESRYRGSRNCAEAIAELFSKSAAQFDRKLVQSFANFVDTQNVWTNGENVSQWLTNLAQMPRETNWSIASGFNTTGQFIAERAFQKTLLSSITTGAIYLDLKQKVILWNRAAEEITGIAALDAFDRLWPATALNLRDEHDCKLLDDECPIQRCLTLQQPITFIGSIQAREDHRRPVEMRLTPVLSPRGVMLGLTMVLQDLSSEKNLKQHLKTLTIAATTDPLTQVANRSEFDRVYDRFLEEHKRHGSPLSVIFTDIDFFKRVNDDYSHEAGDKALASFAAHLSRNCGSDDLVARFGGEEFVILCAETDIQAATERAEQMRSTLQALPQRMLKNRCITASFGVAQSQEGDTASSLLRRADRALMRAKKEGRNRVVSLSGSNDVPETETKVAAPVNKSFLSWLMGSQAEENGTQFEKKLVTSVPVDIVIEKIRGFISDFKANIESTESNSVIFTVDSTHTSGTRRVNDRVTRFRVSLRVEEPQDRLIDPDTMIFVSISVMKQRDRRTEAVAACLEGVYRSLRSYLVAKEFGEKITGTLEPAATRPGAGRE